ncbi:MAG: PaREP1 family protein [Methanophagales archaeon]|nr:PaREP1 family protein [Methanophagales archaeon]
MGMRHSELVIKFLRERENLVDRGDVIQTSGKLYNLLWCGKPPLRTHIHSF